MPTIGSRKSLEDKLRNLISNYERSGAFRVGDVSLKPNTVEFEIVVHFCTTEALTPDFVESIWRILWEFPAEFSVILLAADTVTGKPIMPLSGIRITTNGPGMFPEPEIDEKSRKTTAELHQSLAKLLSEYGDFDPFGNGDYWIVDDWIAPCICKVSVWNIRFVTPALAHAVQKLLQERFPECQVNFQLDLTDAPDDLPPDGIIIRRDQIQEDWDKPRLYTIFGDRFAWIEK